MNVTSTVPVAVPDVAFAVTVPTVGSAFIGAEATPATVEPEATWVASWNDTGVPSGTTLPSASFTVAVSVTCLEGSATCVVGVADSVMVAGPPTGSNVMVTGSLASPLQSAVNVAVVALAERGAV